MDNNNLNCGSSNSSMDSIEEIKILLGLQNLDPERVKAILNEKNGNFIETVSQIINNQRKSMKISNFIAPQQSGISINKPLKDTSTNNSFFGLFENIEIQSISKKDPSAFTSILANSSNSEFNLYQKLNFSSEFIEKVKESFLKGINTESNNKTQFNLKKRSFKKGNYKQEPNNYTKKGQFDGKFGNNNNNYNKSYSSNNQNYDHNYNSNHNNYKSFNNNNHDNNGYSKNKENFQNGTKYNYKNKGNANYGSSNNTFYNK